MTLYSLGPFRMSPGWDHCFSFLLSARKFRITHGEAPPDLLQKCSVFQCAHFTGKIKSCAWHEFIWCKVERGDDDRTLSRVDISRLWQKGFCWRCWDDEWHSGPCSLSGLHQGADHGAGVQAAQVVVGLPGAHKHNGLACDVSHGDGSTHLWRRKDECDTLKTSHTSHG